MMAQEPEDLDVLAVEYVLGHLAEAEADSVERSLLTDAALRGRVLAWEERLAPAAALAAPMSPDMSLWPRIEAALRIAAASGRAERDQTSRVGSANASSLTAWAAEIWRSVGFWRLATAAATAAAVLVAFIGTFEPASAPAAFVAILQVKDGAGEAGWIIEVDARRAIRSTPLRRTDLSAERSLQLWTLIDPAKGPVSLGLLPAVGAQTLPSERLPAIGAGQLFEITLEPSGGSTIGRPTGPILYIGRTAAVAAS